MREVFEFIKVYYHEIISLIGIIASVVICCIRKKPVKVVDNIKEIIVRVLPAFIVQAEASGKKGADKLELVLSLVKDFLKEMSYGDDVVSQYLDFTKEQVELILATPQKKGDR